MHVSCSLPRGGKLAGWQKAVRWHDKGVTTEASVPTEVKPADEAENRKESNSRKK